MIMDNNSSMQSMPIPGAQPVQTPVGQPMPQFAGGNISAPVMVDDKKGVGKIIAIIILALTTVTFLGLFIWMFVQFNDVRTDVNGQIAVAVAEAVDKNSMQLEEEFSEREKDPYKTFSGPADYGQLTFEYPKTWSAYVASDASKGGTFNAYFNPGQVDPIENDSINALTVSIMDEDFEKVAAKYQSYVERKDSGLTMKTESYDGFTVNRYDGTIPNTSLQGSIVIFKIRDKTVVLKTDSMLFVEDFNKLLNTIQFNA